MARERSARPDAGVRAGPGARRRQAAPTSSAAATQAQVDADLLLAAGDFEPARARYEALLAQPLEPASRARVQSGLAEALCRLDRGEEAIPHAAAAATAFRALRRDEDQLHARYWEAYGHYQRDALDASRAILADLLHRVRAGAPAPADLRFRLLTALASIASRAGDDARAIDYLHEAEALAGNLELATQARFLSVLSASYDEAGDHEASLVAGLRAMSVYRSAEMKSEEAMLANNLAMTYVRVGSVARADEMAARAASLAAELGASRLLAHVRETQAQVALAQGDMETAQTRASEALLIARETENRHAAAGALQTLGRVAMRRGDRHEAVESLERAIHELRQASMPARLREALAELAELVASHGDAAAANRLYAEAVAIR